MPYVGPITPGRKLSFLPAGQTCAQQSRRPTETCLWFTSLLLRLLTFTSPIIPAWASDDTACGQGLQELLQAGSNVSLPYAQRKTAYERAIQCCPSRIEFYDSLFHLAMAEHEFDEALRWVRRGLRLLPDNPELRRDEAVGLLSSGHPQQALAILKALPKSGQDQFYLGMAYRALREPKAAQQASSEAFDSGYRDPYLLYVLMEQDHILRDKDAGLKHFQILSEQFPDSPWLHMVLGDAHMSRYEDSEAESEYQKVLQISPDLPVVHYQLGFIAFKRAEYSRAVDELRKEISLDPGYGDAYLYLGLSLRRLNRNIEALSVLKKAVALDPNSPLPYRALAAVQSSTNRAAAALKTLQTAQHRFPQEPAFPAQMAALLKQMGRAQPAEWETALAESLSREGNPIRELPGEGPASSNQSNLAGGSNVTGAADNPRGDTDKAPQPATPVEQQHAAIGTPAGAPSSTLGPPMVELRRCVKQRNADCSNTALAAISDPAVLRSAEYLTLKADALALSRQKAEALAVINRAIEQNPGDPQYLIALGRTYDRFGDQFSAIESYLKAAKLEPQSAEPFYWLGASFFLLGERFKSVDYYNRAERHFQSVLELAPNNDKAEFMLALVEVMKSNLGEAQRHLRKVIQMSPSNAYYHLHEGILLRRLGDNQGALGEMRMAEKLNPSYALTRFELGSLLESMQQYREAKAELEAAVRLNPHLSSAYYHLRGIDAHLGLIDESRKAYEQFKLTKAYEEGETSDPFSTVMSSAEIFSAAGQSVR